MFFTGGASGLSVGGELGNVAEDHRSERGLHNDIARSFDTHTAYTSDEPYIDDDRLCRCAVPRRSTDARRP